MNTGGAPAGGARVLVVLAHPDDPEFFCGGTLARWIAEGQRVAYCLLTDGERGDDQARRSTEELGRVRREEQRAAAEVLGVEDIFFLGYGDGFLTPEYELRRDIVRVIRRWKPSVVVTCDPTNFYPSDRYINHTDHRAAGQVALDAVFPAAGSAAYFPELIEGEGLEPHKVDRVYISLAANPNTTIDVTEYFNHKLSALAEHATQVTNLDQLRERLSARMRDPESPPDAPRYIEQFRCIDLRR